MGSLSKVKGGAMTSASLGINHQLSVLADLTRYDRLTKLHADARANNREEDFGDVVDAAICLLRQAKHVAETARDREHQVVGSSPHI